MDYIEKAIEHAMKCYPNECIGYVTNDLYYELENKAKDKKRNALSLDPTLFYYFIKGKLQYIVHSHINCDKLSDTDIETFEAFEVPLLLINIKDKEKPEVYIHDFNLP